MTIDEKIPYAVRAITSITRHDDAPLVDRQSAIKQLKTLIETELAEAATREKAKKAKAETPKAKGKK